MGCKCGGNCKGAQTEIRIKKMRENAKLPEFKNGNWLDTYVSKVGCVDQDQLDNGHEFTFDDVI